jgi:hypothetical protein
MASFCNPPASLLECTANKKPSSNPRTVQHRGTTSIRRRLQRNDTALKRYIGRSRDILIHQGVSDVGLTGDFGHSCRTGLAVGDPISLTVRVVAYSSWSQAEISTASVPLSDDLVKFDGRKVRNSAFTDRVNLRLRFNAITEIGILPKAGSSALP